jgi:ribonuclease HI
MTIYTDGGCHGNPGPGAWAFVVQDELSGSMTEFSGGEKLTTNNKMELTAVIKALQYLLQKSPLAKEITLVTDSQYVKNGETVWIKNWKKNGWRTANKQPVKNADLWTVLDELAGHFKINWRWTKGHAGDLLNERCDALVQEAIAKGAQF